MYIFFTWNYTRVKNLLVVIYWSKNLGYDNKFIYGGFGYFDNMNYFFANNNFKIVDRKKDLVLVSGFNVYPNEIEDTLAKMDAVLEAAVVGVPDANSGEAVRAYIVKNPEFAGELTKDMVVAHCKGLLTDYKIPKSIIFRDELPKSPIGKILRKDLKAEVKAEFNK